jgi:hypothetical protein
MDLTVKGNEEKERLQQEHQVPEWRRAEGMGTKGHSISLPMESLCMDPEQMTSFPLTQYHQDQGHS